MFLNFFIFIFHFLKMLLVLFLPINFGQWTFGFHSNCTLVAFVFFLNCFKISFRSIVLLIKSGSFWLTTWQILSFREFFSHICKILFGWRLFYLVIWISYPIFFNFSIYLFWFIDSYFLFFILFCISILKLFPLSIQLYRLIIHDLKR